MRFGVCTSVSNAAVLKAAGWDFVEENVQSFLQPEVSDAQWLGGKLSAASPLPVETANVLVPGRLKITGVGANLEPLRVYMATVVERARRVGIDTLVFGAGVARQVEEGFDRAAARRQIVDFARMSADLAAAKNVILVAEPLRRAECNIINSVTEAMEYVGAVDRANFECLVDSYHFWEENEPFEPLIGAMPHIRHVHVADRGSRLAPGQSSPESLRDYGPFFRVLKAGGYDGRISVEAGWKPGLAADAAAVLLRLQQLWADA